GRDEGRGRGGGAGGIETVRTECGERVRGADGAVADRDGERAGDHGSSRVLRDGEERGVPFGGGEGASGVAHSVDRGDRAGSLHDADDHDAVQGTGELHRVHAELLYGDGGRVAILFP